MLEAVIAGIAGVLYLFLNLLLFRSLKTKSGFSEFLILGLLVIYSVFCPYGFLNFSVTDRLKQLLVALLLAHQSLVLGLCELLL